MYGILYGVGVGPGDPELLTLKAVRLIRENEYIAVPGERAEDSVAYKIAVSAAPELAKKKLLPVSMPMIRDAEALAENNRMEAKKLEEVLKEGHNIVFLTLGDPMVYSTFSYLQKQVSSDGYPIELVSGVPSFCAAAARLGVPLTEWDEQLHIIPAVHGLDGGFSEIGTYIFMKAGKRLPQIKAAMQESGRELYMVENCGMAQEKIYCASEELPKEAGYYSLVIAKKAKKEI